MENLEKEISEANPRLSIDFFTVTIDDRKAGETLFSAHASLITYAIL